MNTRMMFARGVAGAVKVIVALALVAVLLGVLAAVEMDQSDKWHGGAIFVAVVVPLIAIQFYSFARQKPVKGVEGLGNDDGGIDWREENVGGEMVDVRNGWAVLLSDVPVHEAKALAEKLEESHVRCRLELLKEDRAFHRFGDGGMGTRMRVLVAPSDYDAAKKLLLEGEKR
ncbi:MAG: hypothetical protein IKO55_05630 [Kiritimatiellae bacterium]|nr:hypothetical protein [Kiritimatiellia bacterium]